MSDFDKKKPSIKNDTDTDEIYEIPDIVTGGTEYKEAKEPKLKKEKRVKPMKQTNLEDNKEKHNKENKKHTFEMRNKKHNRKAAQDDIMEDLEFISEESVKDKSRMAEGKPISHELVSKKKTLRRSVDEMEAKKEKSVAFMRRNIAFVGIACLVVVVAICAIVIGVRSMKSKKKAENKNHTLSTQEYEKDEHAEINELFANYYKAYAAGDTEELVGYANPITDMEKSYISMYSLYIEKFDNITCYTKTGADENSYIVSVAYDLKYKNVETAAPGLDFFYVRTNDKGQVYIDNTYSSFNLNYQENPLDDMIRQLITDYEAGEDVIALQANVQTRYEEAIAKDADLKNMIETTIINAINEWKTAQEQQAQQKAQEVANQVAAEQQQQDQQAAEQQQQDQQAADQQQQQDQQQAQTPTETEQKAWVYATETMNIRQEPSEQSAVLASALQGSELRQLAVTSDGWSKVKTGDIVGYVKTEYVTTQHP